MWSIDWVSTVLKYIISTRYTFRCVLKHWQNLIYIGINVFGYVDIGLLLQLCFYIGLSMVSL